MTGDDLLTDQLAAPQPRDLNRALAALQSWDGGAPSPDVFYGLSDLDDEQLLRYERVWLTLTPTLRASLLQHLAEAGESNIDLDYRAPGLLALDDEQAEVRRIAINLLWEDDSRSLLHRLLRMAREDTAFSVRATAAGALGRFVLAGELGKLAPEEQQPVHQVLVEIWQDPVEDDAVRRRALESLANCGHALVPAAIDEAWQNSDPDMQASALYAMGRSCDQRWVPLVLEALAASDAALLYEAVRACGELEIESALPRLVELSCADDREIAAAAVLALGETGGRRARQHLEALAEEARDNNDDSLMEVIEDALGNAASGGQGPGW